MLDRLTVLLVPVAKRSDGTDDAHLRYTAASIEKSEVPSKQWLSNSKLDRLRA